MNTDCGLALALMGFTRVLGLRSSGGVVVLRDEEWDSLEYYRKRE